MKVPLLFVIVSAQASVHRQILWIPRQSYNAQQEQEKVEAGIIINLRIKSTMYSTPCMYTPHMCTICYAFYQFVIIIPPD